jgi:hypothetical protein
MANLIYPKAKEGFATKQIDWVADTIKAMLVDAADYTPNTATDQFLSDIPLAAREETSSALTGKSATNGQLAAANPTFSGTAGDPCEYIVVYQDTGVAGTSRLLVLIDTAGGLPVTLGGNVTIAWNSGLVASL